MIFEWICRECEVYWERDCKIGKAPGKTKCPECNKLCERYWQHNVPAVHFLSKGFPDRDRKLAKTGGHVSGDSDEVCKELIKDSERAMQHGNAMYQRVVFNPEGWNKEAEKLSGETRDKAGHFRPISEKRRREKENVAKIQTETVYDKNMTKKTSGPNDPRIKIQ